MTKIFEFPISEDQKEHNLMDDASSMIVDGMNHALDLYNNKSDLCGDANHEYISYLGLCITAGSFMESYGVERLLKTIGEVIAKELEE